MTVVKNISAPVSASGSGNETTIDYTLINPSFWRKIGLEPEEPEEDLPVPATHAPVQPIIRLLYGFEPEEPEDPDEVEENETAKKAEKKIEKKPEPVAIPVQSSAKKVATPSPAPAPKAPLSIWKKSGLEEEEEE